MSRIWLGRGDAVPFGLPSAPRMAARPGLFGGLLDVLSKGMACIDSVVLPSTPRMADFARWGVAVEEALGFQPGQFMLAYQDNREEANAVAVESSPIAKVIVDFLLAQEDHHFRGTPLELLQRLDGFTNGGFPVQGKNQHLVQKHPRWPKAANQLSAEIARIEPNLAKLHVQVVRGRDWQGRFVDLELLVLPNVGHVDHVATKETKSKERSTRPTLSAAQKARWAARKKKEEKKEKGPAIPSTNCPPIPSICEHCQEHFPSKRALSKHIRTKHPDAFAKRVAFFEKRRATDLVSTGSTSSTLIGTSG
jgi:hypothetical protein